MKRFKFEFEEDRILIDLLPFKTKRGTHSVLYYSWSEGRKAEFDLLGLSYFFSK